MISRIFIPLNVGISADPKFNIFTEELRPPAYKPAVKLEVNAIITLSACPLDSGTPDCPVQNNCQLVRLSIARMHTSRVCFSDLVYSWRLEACRKEFCVSQTSPAELLSRRNCTFNNMHE